MNNTALQISCMDISSGGELGVCSSSDGQLWIWEVDTGVTRVLLVSSNSIFPFVACFRRSCS